MASVYILRDRVDDITSALRSFDARFTQHLRGHTATTQRLGGKLEIVAKKRVAPLADARKLERVLKGKKSPKLAIYNLQQ